MQVETGGWHYQGTRDSQQFEKRAGGDLDTKITARSEGITGHLDRRHPQGHNLGGWARCKALLSKAMRPKQGRSLGVKTLLAEQR
jgi:hypothetical protein